MCIFQSICKISTLRSVHLTQWSIQDNVFFLCSFRLIYKFMLPMLFRSWSNHRVIQWLFQENGNCARVYSFQDWPAQFFISICSLYLWNCLGYLISLADKWLEISPHSPIRSTIESLSTGNLKGFIQPDGTSNSEIYLHR